MNKHLFTFILLLLSFPTFAQKGDDFFDPNTVHEIRFTYFQSDWWEVMDTLYEVFHGATGTTIPYTKAFVTIDGEALDTVGIRQKGLSSNGHSSKFKKPFKVDLNEFISGQEYDGLKKFNLHNGACDPGMLRDFLCYNMMRVAGVAAPRVAHCRLYMNDEYWGLYSMIEQVDKTFVGNNFTSAGGTLIKNIGWTELHWEGDTIQPYLEDFQLKTNENTDDWSDFIHFLDVLNNWSDADFKEEIVKIFDVDNYLHVMAIDIMTNNWDSYIDNERNFYLYREPSSKQYKWIPWDYNLALGGDFTLTGTPYPPFDTSCYLQATFSHFQSGNTFLFFDESVPYADSVKWDFGDGGTSSETMPVHTYSNTEEVYVCMESYRTENGQTCQSRRCKSFDLGFQPSDCLTIQNGTCPYPASDPTFQLVAQQDDYCCNDTWDALCEVQYFNLQQAQTDTTLGTQGVPDYTYNFPLMIQDTNKILIQRLMKFSDFRKRYFDITCLISNLNFTQQRLWPLIDQHADKIRPHIYEDPNYNFNLDYFEYDVGNGTGGGGGADIPALKDVLGRRFDQVADNQNLLGLDCNAAFSPIGWHDIVINEFMASNSNSGGIADPAGGFGDWIELYNNSNQVVDLKNFYMTDDQTKLLKWDFPFGTQMQPHSYLIVWADKDEFEEGIHTNFNLSKAGETIMLLHESGTMIDRVDYGQQITNLASARIPNGTGAFQLQAATFGGNNDFVSEKTVQKTVQFSLYPNPAHNMLFLDFQGLEGKKSIVVRNTLGQVFYQKTIAKGSTNRIDVSSLTEGIYFLEVRMPDGRISQERFMVW